jgi:hypothetical protein
VPNASLQNSSITFGSTAQALGSTVSALNGVSIGATTASTGAFTNLAYTGTLTGGTGVINIGSGQLYKDASGKVGIGTSSPTAKLNVEAANFSGGPAIGARFNTSNDRIGFGIANANGFPYIGYNTNNAASSDTPTYDLSRIATQLRMDNGQFRFNIAPSGTAGNAISFTQALTLNADVSLYLGTTSNVTNGGFRFFKDYDVAGSSAFEVGHIDGSSSGNRYASFLYNGSVIGSITQDGTTGVLYNVTSDQRLKENIQDAAPASALIDALQVRQYDWKSDGSHQRYGFVAQELLNVAPEAVHQPADPEAMMAVDYSKLVPMLVKEIQSLRARLAAANI